ncbi:hypothetical protein [Deefgea sp. CFH1-16]|uniref:hypothetical protein n=1 Tax=Deefgea sp. CFH1-16 TaxID=2675457 RepID=UPI0015F6C325|nr:hypothetical protein [Deefgea sp. CFH1-16]MBM5575793.1 hypothetical protein [Deefgea sp. CFH1-16]
MNPKPPRQLSPEAKQAALQEAAPINTAELNAKETGGKPWLLADKKTKFTYLARLDGDINAKLEFILEQMGRGASKNALINQALDEFANKWLQQNGFIS